MTYVSVSGFRANPKTPAQAVARMAYWRANGTYVGVGMCMRTVSRAYGWYGSGEQSAWSFWRHEPERYCHYTGVTSAPAGALIIWRGGPHGYGHVAISAGNGYCYSTDIARNGRVDLVPITRIQRQWGLVLRGWCPPYMPYASGRY